MATTKKWRVVGVNFDHMHMGDLLRQVFVSPNAEIVGVCDLMPERMQSAIKSFSIPPDRAFVDVDACMTATKPDLAVICSSTATHADYVEKVAPYGCHVLVEKPFAASLAQADRMIAATRKTGKMLAINWPIRWYPSHTTAKRLIDEGVIGEPIGVHHYGGNRGPMRHLADKVGVDEEKANREKGTSWFYQKAAGGGSLLDYLGYGTTLGTWFMNGRAPLEVTAMVDSSPGLEVDEHSVTVVRYDLPGAGLSKFETRWGTFTDPWITQPQPKCGFVIVGRKGTISSYDYDKHVHVQTGEREEGYDVPAAPLPYPYRGPIEYMIDRIETAEPIDMSPMNPVIARVGQQIVDSAVLSTVERRTVKLVG